MFPKGTTRTSISIITKRIGVVLAALFFEIVSSPAQTVLPKPSGGHSLQQEVSRLGIPGNNDFQDIHELARTPAASAGILIAQLHLLPHPERTIVEGASPQTEHVLLSLIALRYITGSMDFCAPTKWKPGRRYEEGIRNYWLHFYSKSCITFFSVWPSRGRTYVAPIDAQREIISAWQKWYAKKGKKYNYKPLVKPESWQWTEGVDKLIEVDRVGKVVATTHPQ